MEWINLSENLLSNETVLLFMSQGGPILWWLAGLNTVFWWIAIERGLYVFVHFPKRQKIWLHTWSSRQDHQSWFAQKQRDAWLSQAHLELFQNIHLLKLIITLFPMLGLLGTVTGMISVFDVLAEQGTSQPRLMAAGISMATLPTMAGMVSALAGMFCYSRLLSSIEKKEVHLEQLMRSRS